MSAGALVLWEDAAAGRFEPVALTRSVARLRLGLWTHRERWARLFPERGVHAVVRGALAAAEREAGGWESVNDVPAADTLFVAAALGRPSPDVLDAVRALPVGTGLLAAGRLVAARTAPEAAPRLGAALAEAAGEGFGLPGRDAAEGEALLAAAGLSAREVAGEIPRTLVDLMRANAAALAADFAEWESLIPPADPAATPGACLVEPDRIRLADGVRLDPNVVLDASDGPILLGPGTRVMAGSVLLGPVATGRDCLVKPLARVMDGTSLGPVCRVGGEVDATIVQGFSNKQHDGFLGHSYLGCWVNLGAATDTSDLKNDYGDVRLTIAGEELDTRTRSVGSLIGDHTKTAIHTRLNTGTVLGACCNVFGADFPPRALPSFSWGGPGSWEEYRVEKAVAVARTVTARRGVELGAAAEGLLRALHAATAPARA